MLYQGGKIRRLDRGCTVIGAFEKLPDINEEIVPLHQGDLIMCFTDGLADLRNAEGELFEDKGIEDFAMQYGSENAKEFNDALLSRIDNYKGESAYPDDIAVITCKIKKFL